jgi:hypothetical protein
MHLLSSFNGRFWAKQEGPRTLLLKTEDTGWLSNMFSRALRVTPEVSVGDVYDRGLFRATITEVTPEGHDALEVTFTFSVPLDDPSVVFLCYDGDKYVRWEPSPEWTILNDTINEYGF